MRHIAKIGLIWFFPLIILFLLCASITAAGQENQNRETLAAVAAAAGGQSREDEEQKKLSAAVESYREKILEKAKSVGIEEYVDHLLTAWLPLCLIAILCTHTWREELRIQTTP